MGFSLETELPAKLGGAGPSFQFSVEPLAKLGFTSAPSTPPSASGAARHALSASVLYLSMHDAPKPRLAMFRTQPTNSVGIAKLAFCNWLN
jgi:hypothetical protein